MDLDPNKQRLATVLKWITGIAAAVIVSPIVFLAVKGLIGLGVALVIGLAIVNFAPVLSMRMANWKLLGIKSAARANPIETLQNQLRDRRAKLIEFAGQITEFSTACRGFEDKVKDFAAAQPENAQQFRDQVDAMHTLLARRRQKYVETKAETDKFEQRIGRADALWKMGEEAAKMNRFARQQDAGAFEKIKTEVALDAVQDSMNRAFADLEMSLLEETDTNHPALTHTPADVIEMPVLTDVVAVKRSAS